ncbi:REJ domain [Micractinium conductrix]|uniref:REJ domain n=1 Tax=Micractinium conductrix TaxID=554055 RepID=A0A2P6VMK9_9CHLO|nr:REJ domain [Micractinium conductrix]|eukprot:PSC75341.1 REJ domain [Micractinium conductrix]
MITTTIAAASAALPNVDNRCEECWDYFTCATKLSRAARSAAVTTPAFCLDCRDGDNSVWFEFITWRVGRHVNAKGQCVKCPDNCDVCKNISGKCTLCQDGFAVKDGECVECGGPSQCKSCDGDRPDLCTACKLDEQEGRCVETPTRESNCPGSCFTCDMDGRCVTCSEGGVDATTGACVPCRQRGCTDCGWDADRCDFCSEGHHFESSTGTCIPCTDPNCSYCDESPDACTACGLNGPPTGVAKDGSCEPCHIPGCIACPHDASTCQECAAGTRLLDARGPCTPCEQAGCACSAAYDCKYCLEGYESRDNRGCVPVQATGASELSLAAEAGVGAPAAALAPEPADAPAGWYAPPP